MHIIVAKVGHQKKVKIKLIIYVSMQREHRTNQSTERATGKFKRTAFSYSVSTKRMGAVQSMPVETKPVILEKSIIQLQVLIFCDRFSYADGSSAVAERHESVSLTRYISAPTKILIRLDILS